MKNIQWLYPKSGFFILIIPVIIVMLIWGYKKKNTIIQQFKVGYYKGYQRVKMALMVTGVLVIVIGTIGPAQEDVTKKVTGDGLDIYVLLDTSKSMLAEDIRPSRIEFAKGLLLDFIDELKGDRIGFIPFSSSAYVQMPLTDDYDLAKMFINVMDTEMISGGGSDLGYAIDVAKDAFEEGAQGDQVILILSDGEDHNAKTQEMLKSIDNKKIKVFSVGIGTDEGALIPEYNQEGTKKIGYKKTEEGQAVMSRLNETLLKEVANRTNGHYYNGKSIEGNGQRIEQDMLLLNRGNQVRETVLHYKHLYQYFLGLGLGLFFIGFMLPERSHSHV